MIFARARSLQQTIQVGTMATTQRSARSKSNPRASKPRGRSKNNPRASKPRGRSKSKPRARPNETSTLSMNKWTSLVVQFVTRCAWPILYFAVQGVLHLTMYICAPPTGWYEPALVAVNLLMVGVCHLLNGTPLCNPCVELYASLRKAYHSPTSIISSLVVLCLASIVFRCLDSIKEHQLGADSKECLAGCSDQIVIPVPDCREDCLQRFAGEVSGYAWCVHVLLMKVVELTKPFEVEKVREVIQPRWLRASAANRGRARTGGVQNYSST